MEKSGGKIADNARELARPFADKLGLELWDVRFVKEGSDWFLRYIIDKPGGVGIEDCEALSRAVDRPLDEADFIDRSYCLEVSSPGLGRKLTRREHFEKCEGMAVIVRFIHPQNSVKEIRGVLRGFDGHTLKLETQNGPAEIDVSLTSYVKLDDDDFDNDTEE